jgi:hypothetical protein
MSELVSRTLGPIQGLPFGEDVTATVPDADGITLVTDTFFIDCAIARIDIDCKCWGSTCTEDKIEYDTTIVGLQVGGVDAVTDVRSVARDVSITLPEGAGGPYVFKVGRTTGKTKGIVRAINVTWINSDDPTMSGSNVMEIDFDPDSTPSQKNCHNNPWFAEHGDSGSLVVDEQGRAIGLIFGVPDDTTVGVTTAAACHILPVLDKLDICIPTTTGTSHGSCGATDGSGLRGSASSVASDDDGIDFGASDPARQPAQKLEPVTLSDAERTHLLALLARFRETARGRELHDQFAHVRRELGYLIRNVRPVKVAWHRTHGPAYLAHTLNHLRGRSASVPVEIDGVARSAMLSRMARALATHGSNQLRDAIERYEAELMPILSAASTADECLDRLRLLSELELTDPTMARR